MRGCSWLSVGMVVATCVLGAGRVGASSAVVVLHDAGLDSNIVARVATTVETVFRLPVRAEECDPVLVLSGGVDAGATLTASNVVIEVREAVFAVVLTPEDYPQLNRRIAKELRAVFLVPALAMRRAPGDQTPVSEQQLRRLEKDVVLLVGLYLGMDACVNPTCGLYVPATEEEFAMKGRNLCPPCEDKAHARVKGMGLFVPYALPPELQGLVEEPATAPGE